MKLLRAIGWLVWIAAGLAALAYYIYDIATLRAFAVQLKKALQ